MLTDLFYLFTTSVLTFVLYPFWIKFVYRFEMGEDVRSDGPQTHLKKQGTPTMGGIVFMFTLVTFVLNRSRTQTLFPIFVAALAGLFGLIEDFSKVFRRSGLPGFFSYHFPLIGRLRFNTKLWTVFKDFWKVVGSDTKGGLSTHNKFFIQAAIAGFVSYWTYFKLGWDYIWFPLIGDVHIGFLYPVFVFVLFIVVLNSVAFTDGLDGLAGGLALIAMLAYWVIAAKLGYLMLAGFCATFVGALIPFLYFNVFPARIFMGNVGSHVLGAVMTLLAVLTHRETALIFICLVFLIDGISSPLQSLSAKLTKKRIFRMAPIHHHFELLGWPETKVTMRFWLAGAFSGLFGILIALL